jgi:Co/Zn/Cd efflux system component
MKGNKGAALNMEQNGNHNHRHGHEPPASLKNLLFAMVINGGIVVFEMIFGLLIQILPFSAGELEHCNHCN